MRMRGLEITDVCHQSLNQLNHAVLGPETVAVISVINVFFFSFLSLATENKTYHQQ